MTRRIIAIIAALVLAAVGSVLLASWVRAADRRAVAELAPMEVLVATGAIAEGTPAETVASMVEVRPLPGTAVAPTAVKSLEDISGLVAATPIEAGEQLLTQKFVEPAALERPDEIEAPAGMHEISVQLEQRRVVGGRLQAGDTVAVFVSLTVDSVQQTHLVLSKAVVTRVDGGIAPTPTETPSEDPADSSPGQPQGAPAGNGQVMVTFALAAADAEKLVFGTEWGTIWLSKEPLDATTDGTRVLDGGSYYQ